MLGRFFLVFFSVLISTFQAQILTVDRSIKQDTTRDHKYGLALNISFSNNKQRKNLIDFSSRIEFDRFFKNKYLFVFLGKTDVTYNGKTVLQNNGYFQLRFRDNDSRRVSIDLVAQGQWNGIQGMEHRVIAGVHMRNMWFEKKKSDLYTTIGTFYENEQWNPLISGYAFLVGDSSKVYRSMFRLNTTAKFSIKLGKNIDFSGMSYLQFPMNSHFTTPRWVFDSQMQFNVNKNLSFVINYNHNYDLYRPLPIDYYFYSISTGIQLKF